MRRAHDSTAVPPETRAHLRSVRGTCEGDGREETRPQECCVCRTQECALPSHLQTRQAALEGRHGKQLGSKQAPLWAEDKACSRVWVSAPRSFPQQARKILLGDFVVAVGYSEEHLKNFFIIFCLISSCKLSKHIASVKRDAQGEAGAGGRDLGSPPALRVCG